MISVWYSIVQFQLKTVPVKKQFQLKTVPVKNNFSASAFLRSVSAFQLVCLSLSVYLVYSSLSVYLLVFISRVNLVFFRKMSWYNFASETLESILVGAVGSAVAKGVDVACKWYTSDTPPPVPDSAGELTAHPIIELVAEPIVVTEEELPSVSSFVTAYDDGLCVGIANLVSEGASHYQLPVLLVSSRPICHLLIVCRVYKSGFFCLE